MLKSSQPLDPKFCKKYELDSNKEAELMNEQNIQLQRIGRMFDFIDTDEMVERRPSLRTRLRWKWHQIKDGYYDRKYTIRNHLKWHKTMRKLRPWVGDDGLITVMQAHLRDYVLCEIKYGHSEKNYKKQKIASAKEAIKLLQRMKNPDGYIRRRRNAVEVRYPKYQTLITEYTTGGTSFSGDFVVQGNGWVGRESGKDPREGYFEFVDGHFELVDSPDQKETDRLLDEHKKYCEELTAAYIRAESDSDRDFERLGVLLKENLYRWWD